MQVGGITTTEVCNISCSMCHFNGPTAIRKAGTLSLSQVAKFIDHIEPGQDLWFAGTGELFMDPNALSYLRLAYEAGHKPCILTNGQLLTPDLMDKILETGVRLVRISVDAIEPDHYRKVRQGGELSVILEACEYLKQQKTTYPDLRVEVNNTLFLNTFPKQDEFIEFWRGKVDAVNFNAEYYNILKFRNKFFEPAERVDCDISVYLLPTGQMAPCCAMMVYQHYNDVSWLPHIDNTTPQEAYDSFVKAYDDSTSKLRQVCASCEWWIMWAQDENGRTPYWRHVTLTDTVTEAVAPGVLTATSEAANPAEAPELAGQTPDTAALEELFVHLAEAKKTIQEIEQTSFWQLRKAWLQFRQAFKFGSHDPVEVQLHQQPSDTTDLQSLQAELDRLNAVIAWMKTSKFWKLRNALQRFHPIEVKTLTN